MDNKCTCGDGFSVEICDYCADKYIYKKDKK